MDFGSALYWVKKGKTISRSGWNGKGMHIEYVSKKNVFDAKTNTNKVFEPYLVIYNINGTYNTWVPSISDLLAEDWAVETTARERAEVEYETLKVRLDKLDSFVHSDLFYDNIQSDETREYLDIQYHAMKDYAEALNSRLAIWSVGDTDGDKKGTGENEFQSDVKEKQNTLVSHSLNGTLENINTRTADLVEKIIEAVEDDNNRNIINIPVIIVPAENRVVDIAQAIEDTGYSCIIKNNGSVIVATSAGFDFYIIIATDLEKAERIFESQNECVCYDSTASVTVWGIDVNYDSIEDFLVDFNNLKDNHKFVVKAFDKSDIKPPIVCFVNTDKGNEYGTQYLLKQKED